MSALMIQGATSSAGKSLITVAFARALQRRGIDVAPFKAQNMSNNARVVDGGEIGTAQYLQALAADIEPDVRMNPVLVKPEGETESQLVVLGKVDHELSALPWRRRSAHLRSVIESSLRGLLAEHELVLIEGAGSPAEINLRDIDLANMHVARLAGAPVVLVADIDRGGAFAHLYGTWALLAGDERARIAGFLLNKFRGDRALLAPAPQRLHELTGVPMLGVLPWLAHGLPDEDGAAAPTPALRGKTVAVVRYPTASNLDEFKPLEQVARLRWVASPDEIDGVDLVVLPGSKHVAADLAWLQESGLAAAVCRRTRHGGAVLGICGGMQMLGEHICAESEVDGSAEGLGLLPIRTSFARAKRTQRSSARFCELAQPWSALSGRTLDGYQIRHGASVPTAPLTEAISDRLAFVQGAVLGVYLHGLFEQPEIVCALFGEAPARSLDDTFDALADAIEEHVDVEALLVQAVRATSKGGGGVSAAKRPGVTPREPPPPPKVRPRSLVLVNTGDGKGKSTAAFGVLMRGVARGWRVCVIQFIKSGKWKVGEETVGRRLGVDWLKGGDGFTWESSDLHRSEGRAVAAWQLAVKTITAGEHQLVVLDEITYPMNWGWIDTDAVLEAIRGRPAHVNIVATGRDAPGGLVELADTVTEMVKVRHAYDRGIRARRGLDF